MRASFLQERIKYLPNQANVAYRSKYGSKVKEFNTLEWRAVLVSHILDRGAQTVHYYGHYSNAIQEERLKKENDGSQYHIIERMTLRQA